MSKPLSSRPPCSFVLHSSSLWASPFSKTWETPDAEGTLREEDDEDEGDALFKKAEEEGSAEEVVGWAAIDATEDEDGAQDADGSDEAWLVT